RPPGAVPAVLVTASRAEPLPDSELHDVARELGADIPYFLVDGPQLGTGDGTELSPLDLPQDYWIVLVLPKGAAKPSTGDVFAAFDAGRGEGGYDDRRAALLGAVRVGATRVARPFPRRASGCPARVTSPRSHRTISPRRRSRTSSLRW